MKIAQSLTIIQNEIVDAQTVGAFVLAFARALRGAALCPTFPQRTSDAMSSVTGYAGSGHPTPMLSYRSRHKQWSQAAGNSQAEEEVRAG